MRKLFTILLTFIAIQSYGKTFYLSNTGNDASDGQSPATAFKTLAKLNSVFSSINAGDNILFNRGDIFYGKITITKSGTATARITIGAYGTGADPIITGFTTADDWTNLGNNIWESNAISTLKYTSMVTVNGVNIPMGRYPNTGYLVWQSHTGNVIGSSSTLTSSSLTGNWTGAEVAFNSTTYEISRDKITAQSGSTLTYTTPNPVDLFQAASTYFVQSFIIQNDIRTLDAVNEWYYNPSTKKISIYSSSAPTGVQVSTIDTLVYLNGRSYITIDNISFEGANSSAIEANNSNHIVVQNCDFYNSGRNGIHGGYNSLLTSWRIENNTFNHTYNNAIDLGASSFDTVRSNTILNTGNVPFNMANYTVNAIAIMCQGASNLIEYNRIDSVGYCGVRHLMSNTIIQNNYITNFCVTFYDGGGTYSWNGPKTTYSGIKILNNIILNGNVKNHGIYLDQATNGVLIQGNTLVNCERGIYLDNSFNMQVLDNTCYDNTYGILMDKRDVSVGSNITMQNNIFFARTSSERVLWDLTASVASFPTPFNFDNNYYARPIDDNLTFQTYLNAVFTQRSFAGWQALNAQDTHSHKSPKTVTSLSDIRFEYNPTPSNKTMSLDANYIDVKSKSYNGAITLEPYASAVLIRNGAATGNRSPVANAGPDKIVNL